MKKRKIALVITQFCPYVKEMKIRFGWEHLEGDLINSILKPIRLRFFLSLRDYPTTIFMELLKMQMVTCG